MEGLIGTWAVRGGTNSSAPFAQADEAIRRTGDGSHRLSFAQERLWFIERLEGASAGHNIAWAVRLKGALNTAALQKSLDAVVARQSALRTCFREVEGVPLQFVEAARPVELRTLSHNDNWSEEDIRKLLAAEASRRFDLTKDLLIRGTLLCLGPEDHVLLLVLHQIAADEWSRDVLLREVSAFYSELVVGTPVRLQDLPISYADYAEWRRRCVDLGRVQEDFEYWRRQLDGSPEILNLPTDYARPALQSYRGGTETVVLPSDLVSKLEAVGRDEGVTPLMTLSAAWQTLLHRYTGQTDIVVGTTVPNRGKVETEDLIGLFSNAVVIRTDLSGEPTFRDVLRRVREATQGAYAHQDAPFEKMVDFLHRPRQRSHHPIFQAMLSLEDEPVRVFAAPGLDAELMDVGAPATRYDLALRVVRQSGELLLQLDYRTDLFEPGTAARMLRHYEVLLRAAVQSEGVDVSQLPLLTDGEMRQLLVDWNQTQADYPRCSTLELFELQAARTPGAIAVVHENRRWTYEELNQEAERVACMLRNHGVGRGSPVAICVERSFGMLAGLLGIWKAGGAYVPLDPSYPRDRLSFILQDVRPAVLLTEKRVRKLFAEPNVPVVLLEDSRAHVGAFPEATSDGIALDDVAYVIYTSGSTGKPKGVPIRHGSLTNLLHAMRLLLQPTTADAMLGTATIAFDISVVEMFLPLIVGARFVIVRRSVAADGLRLARTMEEEGVTITQGTPTTWQMLFETGWKGKSGLKIVCGGETLTKAVGERLLQFGQIYHAYGPTETTICSTATKLLPSDETYSIGRPLANTRLYVLDGKGQPVPVGVPGELYIGGEGVADGYWNRPELTAARFVSDPFAASPNSRLYRTGDLVRYRPDGDLVFLGRIDGQVKVRGYRIELGEIETILLRHERVQKCAVVVREDASKDKQLVAYFEPQKGSRLSAGDLRAHLKKSLPDYMLPSAFVRMERLPLLPSAKIDRTALPAPQKTRAVVSGSHFVAPRNAVETKVAGIWGSVLGLAAEGVGIRDNFYDMGGSSLKAVQVCFQVRNHFRTELPLAIFYEDPTIQGIASFLANRRSDGGEHWAAWQYHRVEGSVPPLIGVHGVDDIFVPIAGHIAPKVPFHTLTSRAGFDGHVPPYHPCRTIEDMAEHYLHEVRSVRPQGPYFLVGFCGGGLIAYEMARRLAEAGEDVPFLGLFNCVPIGGRSLQERVKFGLEDLAHLDFRGKVQYVPRKLANAVDCRMQKVVARAKGLVGGDPVSPRENESLTPEDLVKRIVDFGNEMVVNYSPQPYNGKVWLFYSEQIAPRLLNRWHRLAKGGVESSVLPGEHITMMEEPHVREVAAKLNARLMEAIRPKFRRRPA